LGGAICAWAVWCGGAIAAVPPSDTLLPGTTKGYLSISDAQKVADQWQKTQLGQLMKDPAMEPFMKDLQHQLQERFSKPRERLGITLTDLQGVFGGEVATALIQPAAQEEAVALLVDVTGHADKAQALLKKVSANLVQQGAQQGQVQVLGTTVMVFTLPPAANDAAKAPAAPGAAVKPVAEPPRHAMYFLKDNLLCGSDQLAVIKGILTNLGGKPSGTLSQVKAYQEVMKRLKADLGDATPQVRWYVEPFGYFETIRTARPEARRTKRNMIDVFQNEGFSALQGIGGTVDFAVDRYEIAYRTAIYAPPPYRGAMQMIKFPNGTEFTPQPWVPGEVAGYTTFYFDVANAFDHFESLFDALYNEGKPGLWKKTVESMATDRNGPQVHLRRDVAAQLGQRVTLLTDYQLPITTASERMLFAIEAKDQVAEKVLANSIGKLFKNDPEFRRRTFEGHEIWEMVPEEKSKVPTIELTLPGSEPPAAEPSQGRQSALLPNQALTVAYGHLFVASHYDFLEKILKQAKAAEARDTLAKSIDYQVVARTFKKAGGGAAAAQNFAKTDELYRPTYELIRQGKMPESETMLARALNTLMGAGKKGELRKQAIEGSKMPDYDLIRRQLGPAGLQVTSEENGWFFKGFLLPKGK
jgi:hypothetical protein